MAPRADSAALNVQPRQRRIVYEGLAKVPEGRSAKDLIAELDIPEAELRETLRKLDSAGLAHRTKGIWKAVPFEPEEAGSEDPAVTSAPPAPAA